MIATLLPAEVAVAVACPEDYASALDPVEAEHVARAVATRRQEFAAGRACARRALSQLGLPAVAIAVGERQQPVWPSGIVGSITHCDGYCAAALATFATLDSIGIDAEVRRALAPGLIECFCTPTERDALPVAAGEAVPLLVFSAKEAFYKAWYTMTARWLDYLDAEVTFDIGAARFEVRLIDGRSLPGVFSGRFAVTRTHVFTAMTAHR